MNAAFFEGSMETANLFISIFILIFAYLFNKKSHSHEHRRPWEFLILAMIVWFVQETMVFIKVLNGYEVPGLRSLLLTLFAGLLLLSFTTQHHLIHHNHTIQIHKRTNSKEAFPVEKHKDTVK
ncbi:MAG: hypothetical protein ABIH41_06680 [Nanoarchaeota archaeon]